MVYRLLIVDDEAIIADGLYEVFQNIKSLDLDIYKAYSGNEALELLKRTRIDIVLTDIRMPGIDGLELLERIHDSWPKCRVIFLTGYNEFDYVYTAIKFEGVSYLLKTEGYGKIIEAVEKAAAEIEKGMRADELVQRAREQLGTMANLLQKDYFSSMLKGEFSIEDISNSQFNDLRIQLDAQLPVLILIGSIDGSHMGCSYSDIIKKHYSIKLIADQYLSTHTVSVHLVYENSSLVWLIQPKAEKIIMGEEADILWQSIATFLKGSLELVQAACNESIGVSISFALDDCPAKWDEIPERFAMLKMLQNYRIGYGEGIFITGRNATDMEFQQITVQNNDKIHVTQSKLEMLSVHLDHGQKDEFFNALEKLTDKLESVKSIHDTCAQEVYYSIALVLLTYINKWNMVDAIAFKTGLYKLMQPSENKDWNEAVNYLKGLCEILFEIQHTEQEKRAQNAVGKIQKYINDNLSGDLSLVRLAELVHFNPSYLSRLFKQVVGENLSDYICEMKIRKAKQLLKNPEVKIHGVAAAVGYGAATNFARFFKKFANVTPQEYRDSFLKK